VSAVRSVAYPLVFIAWSVAWASGCGGESYSGRRVTVSGQVTKADAPVTGASILLISARSGAAFRGELTTSGGYTVDLIDTETGDQFLVAFGPSQASTTEQKTDGAGLPVSSPPPGVPSRYLDGSTSGLSMTTTGDQKQTQDFALDAE
jgi:hypothetical protein